MSPPGTLTPRMRLRLGVVGGGIGKSHCYARCLDHRLTLDVGVFGRSPQWSSALAAELGVPAEGVRQEVRRYTAGRGIDDGVHGRWVRGVRPTWAATRSLPAPISKPLPTRPWS
jgi:hypothetical protein